MTGPRPFVSVVIPCRNEIRYVRPFLDSVLATRYPSDRYEVLVVDGASDDGTRSAVEEYARRHTQVRLIDNPRRITPCALNLGIARAQGAIIIRMDAHAEYPPTYIGDLVDWLERTGADNVGASWHTCPADGTVTARAIAAVTAHRFGIGNARYRLGTDRPRDVDTVPFGCYRREVFQRIGAFDEELVRNQDDEFNFRLLRAGGRIVLVPGVICRYYARRSLVQLARMFYQYGVFKPLVAWKIGRIMTLRQVVPAIFVLALVAAGIAAPFTPLARIASLMILGSYLAVDLACSLGLRSRHPAAVSVAAIAVFPVVHLSYGLGFLRGSLALIGRMRGPSLDLSGTPLTR